MEGRNSYGGLGICYTVSRLSSRWVQRVTQCGGRRGGRKVRARRKEGRERQAGDRDRTVTQAEQITGDGNGANEAPH